MTVSQSSLLLRPVYAFHLRGLSRLNPTKIRGLINSQDIHVQEVNTDGETAGSCPAKITSESSSKWRFTLRLRNFPKNMAIKQLERILKVPAETLKTSTEFNFQTSQYDAFCFAHQEVDRYELQRLCDANSNPPKWEVRDLQPVEETSDVSNLQYSIAVNDVSTRDRKMIAKIMAQAKQGFVNYIHPEVEDAEVWNQEASAHIDRNKSTSEVHQNRPIIEFPRNVRWALKDGDSGASMHLSFQLPIDSNPYVFLSQIFADHSKTLFTNENPVGPFTAFSENEIQEINDLYSFGVQNDSIEVQKRGFGEGTGGKYGFHSVAYIHESCPPKLLSKLKQIVHERSHHWLPNADTTSIHIKKVEYLRYDGIKNRKKGTRDQVGWHTDTDNLFTLIVMLSENFTGGHSEFLIDDRPRKYFPSLGESILFPGEICQHRVAPVLSGSRRVLCVEFWDKEEPMPIEQCLREFDP